MNDFFTDFPPFTQAHVRMPVRRNEIAGHHFFATMLHRFIPCAMHVEAVFGIETSGRLFSA
jgi:hypothetical protein